jgi:ribosome-associated protein
MAKRTTGEGKRGTKKGRGEGGRGPGGEKGRKKSERKRAAPPAELQEILDAVLERNARDAVLLDLRDLSDATDWFVIASGDSDTHVRAIADNVLERAQRHGVRPAGVEGKGSGTWVLLDFIDIVVHVFLPRVREFYRLEELWGDAPTTPVVDAAAGRA